MIKQNNLQARLMNTIPLGRYRILEANINPPNEGDIVNLDQGFTSPDGEPMVIVYCLGVDGSMLYEAEVYEFELSPE